MEQNRNLIGERLRIAREAENPKATQKDICARLEVLGIHISDNTLGKIENGSRPVTDIQLVAIAKVLKVSVNWLLNIDK